MKRMTGILLTAIFAFALCVPASAEMVYQEDEALQVNEAESIEISLYFEQYEQLVEKLGMMPTESWQFLGENSYEKDRFFLEWGEKVFSMKNDGAPYIKLYGAGIGDSVEQLDKTLLENGWVNYYSNHSECEYLAVINDRSYFAAVQKNETGDIESWYLNNWPQGEDVGGILSELQEKQANVPAEGNESAEQKKAYKAVIEQAEQQYGPYVLEDYGNIQYATGVCYLELRDVDKNGMDELLLVHNSGEMTEFGSLKSDSYQYELWTYSDGKAIQLETGGLYYSNGGWPGVCWTEYDGNTYLVTNAENVESYWFHGFYPDGSFGVVDNYLSEFSGGDWISYLNGVRIDEKEWMEKTQQYMANASLVNLFFENGDYVFQIVQNVKNSLESSQAQEETGTGTGGAVSEGQAEPANVFEMLPSGFTFSSGAGGWATELFLNDDGTFTGQYHDSDMGDLGAEYPNGTVYIRDFSGKFTMPVKVDEFIYSMHLETLNVEGTTGTVYYENGIKYIVSEPYGFENADEFLIYLPGCPLEKTAEDFLMWSFISSQIRSTIPAGVYGIYNVGGMEGFMGEEDGILWRNTYAYSYDFCTSELWPSYYSKSYLTFWPEAGAAALSLGFDWSSDSQTEFVAFDNNGTGEYRIALDFNEDYSSVTVAVKSMSGFNLEPWGGTADGTLLAEYRVKTDGSQI
ncbi:MAG: hypothetical protein MRZ74_04750 [Blautia sp.]|nr:hypothetical protein [Blautia sp.]MDY5031538.1 hypothetical protein [Blautia sp.]